MDQNHRDSNKIFDNINDHIDEATSVTELTPFLKVIPLNIIKQCLKQRINALQNAVSSSNNNTYNNPVCSIQYNEMRKLALSISPITDILSQDVMIHIISFLTKTHCNDYCRDKQVDRYYKFLPVLSSTFQSIMNNTYFYHSKYPLYIHDIDIKKNKKSNDNPLDIHIYVNHSSYDNKIEIMHLKTKKIKSTKTIKKVPQLIPNKALNSSLPWKNRNKLIIEGNITNEKKANPNILNILSKTKPKWLHLYGSIPDFRLKQYSPFTNVVYLNMTRFSNNTKSNVWLNMNKFPSLRILTMNIPSNMTSNKLNKLINSLDLYALHLVTCLNENRKLELNIKSNNLQFLCLGSRPSGNDFFREREGPQNHFIKTLNLSGCNGLIGVQLHIEVPFSSVICNKQYCLQFINITIDDREINNKYGTEWYNAYKNENIYSNIVIGHCFFRTEPKVKQCKKITKHSIRSTITEWNEFIEDKLYDGAKKYYRRRSMKFDEIIDYIGNHVNVARNIQNGWHRFYENNESFVEGIAMNYPRWKM